MTYVSKYNQHNVLCVLLVVAFWRQPFVHPECFVCDPTASTGHWTEGINIQCLILDNFMMNDVSARVYCNVLLLYCVHCILMYCLLHV